LGLTNLSTKRQRIAELARSKRGVALSTLHYVIDLEWMKEAYRLTRKDGAPGIDGVTAADYASSLETSLLDLLERIKSGRYQAPPVRRAYIPKVDGSHRPLGIPTFEDKVAQRAIVMVLEAVYEQDFLPCSYGFRPGRSAHQALRELRNGFMSYGLRWVIDLDIVKYFDSISHSHLRGFLDRRVTDGVIRRMIDKWLKAGVLEDGLLRHATEGSPQGGVISPCLSNIFLHHVLDEWFENEVKPRLKGRPDYAP
jgi:RNA-directed DNA polymerase